MDKTQPGGVPAARGREEPGQPVDELMNPNDTTHDPGGLQIGGLNT